MTLSKSLPVWGVYLVSKKKKKKKKRKCRFGEETKKGEVAITSPQISPSILLLFRFIQNSKVNTSKATLKDLEKEKKYQNIMKNS